MSEPLVFLHGQLIPQSRAHLTLHDAGFVMGATVTDLTRTFGHRLFRWEDHLARFRNSCRLAHLSVSLDDASITSHASRLIEHNASLLAPERDLALVMFATPGPIGYYLGEPGGVGEGAVTFGMHTFPLPLSRYKPLFERGAWLAVPSVPAIPVECVDPQIKQRSRLQWWLAEQEVKQGYPGAQALLADAQGRLTETAAANFLIVKDGTILSPPAGRVLPGITLKVVHELVDRLDISWQEREIFFADAQNADEAFLCSTSFCIAGVSRINDNPVPWPGPVCSALQEEWRRAIGFDFIEQISK